MFNVAVMRMIAGLLHYVVKLPTERHCSNTQSVQDILPIVICPEIV